MNITINYNDLKIIQRLVNDEYMRLVEMEYNEKYKYNNKNAVFLSELNNTKFVLKNLLDTINNLTKI